MLSNIVDPDQTPHDVASDLGLHCLPMTDPITGFHVLMDYFCYGNKVCSPFGPFEKKRQNEKVTELLPLKVYHFNLRCMDTFFRGFSQTKKYLPLLYGSILKEKHGSVEEQMHSLKFHETLYFSTENTYFLPSVLFMLSALS